MNETNWLVVKKFIDAVLCSLGFRLRELCCSAFLKQTDLPPIRLTLAPFPASFSNSIWSPELPRTKARWWRARVFAHENLLQWASDRSRKLASWAPKAPPTTVRRTFTKGVQMTRRKEHRGTSPMERDHVPQRRPFLPKSVEGVESVVQTSPQKIRWNVIRIILQEFRKLFQRSELRSKLSTVLRPPAVRRESMARDGLPHALLKDGSVRPLMCWLWCVFVNNQWMLFPRRARRWRSLIITPWLVIPTVRTPPLPWWSVRVLLLKWLLLLLLKWLSWLGCTGIGGSNTSQFFHRFFLIRVFAVLIKNPFLISKADVVKRSKFWATFSAMCF